MDLLNAEVPLPRVLFVCTGNICRSPMAEAVMRALGVGRAAATAPGIASAGLRGVHAGARADERAISIAAARGYDLREHVARALCALDFSRFDLIVGMGPWHQTQILAQRPPGSAASVCSLPDFVDAPHPVEVPDPYSGTLADFERALDLIEAGCRGLERALSPLAFARRAAPRMAACSR
jgi:protein-tyrosine phosphatase